MFQLDSKKFSMAKYAILVLLFALYLFVGVYFIGYIQSYSKNNIFFGTDGNRIFDVFTQSNPIYCRTEFHPLYVLLTNPIVRLLNLIFNDCTFAVVFLWAIIGTLNVVLVNKILLCLSKSKQQNIASILITALYAISFSVLENIAIVETYILGSTALLLFWLYFLKLDKTKPFGIKQYCILCLLGVLNLSYILTNILQFVIGTFVLLVCYKKSKKEKLLGFYYFCGLMMAIAFISLILALIQKAIYPCANNYITSILNNFILNQSGMAEESSYMSFGASNLVNTIFAFSYMLCGYKVGILDELDFVLEISSHNAVNIIILVLEFVLFGFAIYNSIKNKNKGIIPFVLAFMIEAIFHNFYGNNEILIYSLNYNFYLFFFMYLAFDVNKPTKHKCNLICLLCTIALLVVTFIFNIISFVDISKLCKLYMYIAPYNLAKSFVLLLLQGLMIVGIVLILKSVLNKQKWKINKTMNMSFMCVLCVLIVAEALLPQIVYANQKEYTNNIVYGNYTIMFGMGLRDKYLLEQNGTENNYTFYKYDVSTKVKTEIKTNLNLIGYDITNYTAICKCGNKTYNIVENGTELYVLNNNSKQVLDDSITINIPNFNTYTHSVYLSALFKEVMVNITEIGPMPNYLIYDKAWYRDGALMAMVCDATNNLSQITPWISSLDQTMIYDYARSTTIKEADNLGEMLYLQSLLDTPNQAVIDAVLDEARSLQVAPNSYIQGLTDFAYKPAYQTKWLKFGLTCLGLDSSEFNLNSATDDYQDLCWFYDLSSKDKCCVNWRRFNAEANNENDEPYPYLNWARMHYYQIKLGLNFNSYPLSFEVANYPDRINRYCYSHGWTASEMFLYYKDFENYT